MWFELKVLCFLFVVCSLVSWCSPAGSGRKLRESAWRALDGAIRDLVDYRYSDEDEDDAPVAVAARRRVNSEPKRDTTSAGRKRISAYTMKRVGAKYGWRCARCRSVLRDDFHVDHIVPLHRRLALGQCLDNDADGLQPLCPSCHTRKNHDEQSR